MTKSTRTLKIALAAVALSITAAAVPGAVTPAEAKKFVIIKKHFHHGHFGHHRRFIGPALLLAGAGIYASSHSCYWLKVRARNTGSAYWWDRYQTCISD
jgi:hypothetical protein